MKETGRQKGERISWHPANFCAVKLELEEFAGLLAFEEEHQLNREPLKIDILIIKKKKNAVIEKNFARIFREFNIVEFKSPSKSLSIDDFRKVDVYTQLLILEKKASEDDVTMTFIAGKYPRELFKYFREKRGWEVKEAFPGIFHIEGSIIPIQVVETGRLSAEANQWLAFLRNDVKAESMNELLERALAREEDLVIRSYLNPIVEANIGNLPEVTMTAKMRNYLESTGWTKDWVAWGEARGQNTVLDLMRKGYSADKIEQILAKEGAANSVLAQHK